ncbi:hypothetical protein M408DRAFT_76750 [Serendipita vermifera MAFF 305830]|uniref:CxC6 like cysteine cluster associated with KDZ domain-containing protein n=1 Tax=Serendipita vermifera MAFF 305830 TaxID=933852 RepID=A0A0C3AGU8_SERVB|nr:hypothetical protein M408DRAFT_76750 [Serendipita vermifera MAFF 305830]
MSYQLDNPKTHPVTVFTIHHGPLPGYTSSLYCTGCRTTYKSDYYIQNDKRIYYLDHFNPNERPAFLQSSKHIFMEWRLSSYFASGLAFAWYVTLSRLIMMLKLSLTRVSMSNSARIYNNAHQSIIGAYKHSNWPTTTTLTGPHVSDAFYLRALIEHCIKTGSPLIMSNSGTSQAERLRPLLEERNKLWQGPNRPEWDHCCDGCSIKTYATDPANITNGWIRSMVTDGVTMGHPCCAVPHCENALASHRLRYCPAHSAKENECSLNACSNPAEKGFKTCSNPQCREREERYDERKTAMFQLKRRLLSGYIKDNDTLSFIPEPTSNEIAVGMHHPPAKSSSNTRSQFGRSRTHNEQLCVGSCGIIIGRKTFFASEGIENVLNFWRELFPSRRSKPSFMWFDNNCSVMKVLRSRPEDPLNQMLLPVDVFHFKSKHKESDAFCGNHCNPLLFRHLKTSDNKWTFNSSAAEQTNAWFGKFQAISRELRVDHYNFLLDEVIAMRNQQRLGELEREGKKPFNLGRESLLRV